METITVQHEILQFMHCGKCIDDRPGHIAARDWARLEIGFTPEGVQVWCFRHGINVIHIDFQGQQHPARLEI